MHVGGPQGDKRKKKKRLNAKHIVARSNGFWSHANYILPNSDARIFREKKKKKKAVDMHKREFVFEEASDKGNKRKEKAPLHVSAVALEVFWSL